jgi:hypothetical protein
LLVFTLIISKNKEQNVKGLFSLNELIESTANIIFVRKNVKIRKRKFVIQYCQFVLEIIKKI